MRKRVIALAVVLVFILGITAQAAPVKSPALRPMLNFNGTTAVCTGTIRADETDSISMTVKLWKGNTCLNTWTKSGTGRVSLSKTAVVSHGQTYKVTVDGTVNGVRQPQKSTTKTCP